MKVMKSGLCAMGAAFALLTLSSPASAQDCDRACLEGHVNGFLAALDARDPSLLPTTDDFHYTENTVALTLGDGFWATYSGRGPYSRYFADVREGQVGWFGTLRENGRPALISLRLKVDGGQVSEAEMLIYRNATHIEGLESRPMSPAFDEVVPEGQRHTRSELQTIADSYFNGLVGGTPVVFTDDCNRVENGIQTTNNPDHRSASFPDPAFNPFNMSCDENMRTGLWRYIQRIEPRRYFLIDEERGNVLGMFMFVHPGDLAEVRTEQYGVIPMPANARVPSHVVIAEAFNIRDQAIRAIEAVEVGLPYGQPDGWENRR